MVYVALLRGINVGGKKRVEMSRLKEVFTDLGCTDVSTYINSGNVVFCDDMPADKLAGRIQHKIARTFGFDIPVIVRTLPQIEILTKAIPASWVNDATQKSDILFLWDHIDNQAVLQKISTKPDREDVRYAPGAVIWNIARENITRSSIGKLIQNELYAFMTIRNVNTVRKLYALMQAKKTGQ